MSNDAEKATKIQLDPVDYWKFRALTMEVQAALAEAQGVLDRVSAGRNAFVNELLTKYGPFDLEGRIMWDTETFTVSKG